MFCIILPFCSAAKSSCKLAITSPLQASAFAEKAIPAADCGYTSTPCDVGLLSILDNKIKNTNIFLYMLFSNILHLHLYFFY